MMMMKVEEEEEKDKKRNGLWGDVTGREAGGAFSVLESKCVDIKWPPVAVEGWFGFLQPS